MPAQNNGNNRYAFTATFIKDGALVKKVNPSDNEDSATYNRRGRRARCFRWIIVETGFKLSVGVTGDAELLEIDGLSTQGSRPGQAFGESVGWFTEMHNSDWSDGIRYQIFRTKPATEF